jgi:Tfp pilus assembly protein PilP
VNERLKVMQKYFFNTFVVICLFIFCWGCGEADKPNQSEPVAKKIVKKIPQKTPPQVKGGKISKKQPPDPKVKSGDSIIAKKDIKADKETELKEETGPENVKVLPESKKIKEIKKPSSEDKVISAAKKEEDVSLKGKNKEAKQPEEDKSMVEMHATKVDTTDVYDPTGKVDPFAALVEELKPLPRGSGESKKSKCEALTPLQMIDLSQITLSAVLKAGNVNQALIVGSEGKGFIVKIGDYLGLNCGLVRKILIDKIIVEEEIETLLGKIKIIEREINLPKPPGEI